MARLIGTMDHLLYGSKLPQYVIEYNGWWYYGSSTTFFEVGGVRQRTLMNSALYSLLCQYEFEVKAGLLPNLKHYSVVDIYSMYKTHKIPLEAAYRQRSRIVLCVLPIAICLVTLLFIL